MIDNFPNLPSVVTQKLDGNIQFAPIGGAPIVLVLGTAARGPAGLTSVTRIGDAFNQYGKDGSLVKGLEEVAGFGSENTALFRIGAKSATLYNLGGEGNLIKTVEREASAADDYEVVYLAPNQIGTAMTLGRLRVRNKFGTVVYDDFAGVQATLDAGEVFVEGAFNQELAAEDIISSTEDDWKSMKEIAADTLYVSGDSVGVGNGTKTDFFLKWTLVNPFSLELFQDFKDGTTYGTAALGTFDYGSETGAGDPLLGLGIEKDITGGGIFPAANSYGLCLHQMGLASGSLDAEVTLRFVDRNGADMDGSGNNFIEVAFSAGQTPTQMASVINGTLVLSNKLYARIGTGNTVNLFDIQDPNTQDSGLLYLEVVADSGDNVDYIRSQKPEDIANGTSDKISFSSGTNVIEKNDGWGSATVSIGDTIEIRSAANSGNVDSGYIVAVNGNELGVDWALTAELAGDADVSYRISNRFIPFVRFGTAPGGDDVNNGDSDVLISGMGEISAHAGVDTTNDLKFDVGTVDSFKLGAATTGLSMHMLAHGSGDREAFPVSNGVLAYTGHAEPFAQWTYHDSEYITFKWAHKYSFDSKTFNSYQHAEGNGKTVTITVNQNVAGTNDDGAIVLTTGGALDANLDLKLALITNPTDFADFSTVLSGTDDLLITDDGSTWLAAQIQEGNYAKLNGVEYKISTVTENAGDVTILLIGAAPSGSIPTITNIGVPNKLLNTPALIKTAVEGNTENWLVETHGSTIAVGRDRAAVNLTLANGISALYRWDKIDGTTDTYMDVGYYLSASKTLAATATTITLTGEDEIGDLFDTITFGGAGEPKMLLNIKIDGDIYTVQDIAGGADTVFTLITGSDASALNTTTHPIEFVGLEVLNSGAGFRLTAADTYTPIALAKTYDDVNITGDLLYWTHDEANPQSPPYLITADDADGLTLFDEDDNTITIDTLTYAQLPDVDALQANIVIEEADGVSANYSYDGNTNYFLDDGTDGANLSLMETFEELQRAYRELESTDVDIVVPQAVYLDDRNVADGNSPIINYMDSRIVGRHYPAAKSAGDSLGRVYIEEVSGELEFWWDTDGDGVAEIFPVGQTPITSPSRGSSDPLTDDDFHEVNFAWQLADFCFNLSINDNEAFGVIGTHAPSSRSITAVTNWVGRAPEYSAAGFATRNGSGLLGNKFMAGAIGRDRGFFATSSGYLPITGNFESDADVLKDDNDEMIDLGKYLRVVAGQALFRNSFDTTGFGYIEAGHGAVAGLLSSLTASAAITNKVLPGLQPAFNLNKAKLNALAGARFISFKTVAGEAVIVDGPTATRSTSDYNRDTTFRIVSEALQRVRDVAQPFIGRGSSALRIESMNTNIDTELNAMKTEGSLIDFRRETTQTPEQRAQGIIDIALTLVVAFEIRKIRVKVGLALQ